MYILVSHSHFYVNFVFFESSSTNYTFYLCALVWPEAGTLVIVMRLGADVDTLVDVNIPHNNFNHPESLRRSAISLIQDASTCN